MPSYIEEPEAAACKWVSIREENAKYELPAVFSILIYTHPETGFPLAICDGSYHTLMRTGSSAAVSAKWLARPDSKVLAIFGDGQRRPRARSRPATRSSSGTRCESGAGRRSRSTASSRARRRSIRTSGCSARPTRRRPSRGADVIVTGTHARSPLVDDEWISPGTHIAALGADLKGEQELDPRILQRARVFVDDIRQCREDGEINVPLSEGLITEDDVAGEIGKVIAGLLDGPSVGRPDHRLRLHGHRAAGFRHGPARVRACGRGGSGGREEDDLDVILHTAHTY